MTRFWFSRCLYIFTNQSFRKLVRINQHFYCTVYHHSNGVFVLAYTQVFIPWATMVYA
jgi:hypothetical protein